MPFDPKQLTPLEVLGLTIVGEARGEPIEGQVAVGSVCRNRLHTYPAKYKNYFDVCLEPEQFSCWNSNDPNKGLLSDLSDRMLRGQPIIDIYIQQCLLVASGIYNWQIISNVGNSTYYMVSQLLKSNPPRWAENPKNIYIFGKQTFFNI